ncbi:glutathione synthase [Endozoicomonas ascidiicola]|uniref:glutathione synthase n=1 Tax=Endozoicomonas ascidiicola TaxID=1698521 RepID=UPI00083415DF|nr:glutathione synthase [Endozoicomonas ascidiicola]
MNEVQRSLAIQDAIEWSLMHGMALKSSIDSARHCAFSFAPTLIQRDRFELLKSVVPLMGKLIHGVSENNEFLEDAIKPLCSGDAFFASLMSLHQEIHRGSEAAERIPMLLMRTDFMDDAEHGPKLIEFNGIAAGMGPFGQRAHELHSYLQYQWPQQFKHWSETENLELVPNQGIENLAKGIAGAATTVRAQSGESGQPLFIMVVQPDEDNVYDQHLLEEAIQKEGVKTVRRTFRQLYDQLSSGENHRLMLEGLGGVDAIYLRAGYQHCDYHAEDLDGDRCCSKLGKVRVMMERHRVAINATVSQQLATSKRVQMLLSSMDETALTAFGLTLDEAARIKPFLGEMRPVDEGSADWFESENAHNWVLKNQGEGGGHCVFDDDILPRLKSLKPEEFSAWSLMRRLHPRHRSSPALVVRNGEAAPVDDLISEIGMFTLHLDGHSLTSELGYAGYLIRSKPSSVAEGGVHSGQGSVDSLAYEL